MADTSPSIFNFVRQKVQEGEQWAKLHAHLKHLETINVDAEQQKVTEAKVEQAQLAEQLKQQKTALADLQGAQKKAQETGAAILKDAQTELDNAKGRAEEIIQKAHGQALVAASAASEAVSAKLAERDQVQADIDNLSTQHAALVAEHTKLQAAHDELARKHADLTHALAKMSSSL